MNILVLPQKMRVVRAAHFLTSLKIDRLARNPRQLPGEAEFWLETRRALQSELSRIKHQWDFAMFGD